MTHSTQPQPDQGWSSSFDKDSTGVEVNRYMCVVSAKKTFISNVTQICLCVPLYDDDWW